MTVSPATSGDGKTVYAALQILKVEPAYRALLTNEKLAARQEFLSAFDRGAARVRTAAYALAGLAADGDLLVVRASARLEDLNAGAASAADSGLGRHLTPVALYLGTLPAVPPPPAGRYICLVPFDAAPRLGAPAGARLELLDGRGLGATAAVAMLEGDNPLMGRAFLEAVGRPATGTVRTGLYAEIRDIVDSL